jgi:hypothetical protein
LNWKPLKRGGISGALPPPFPDAGGILRFQSLLFLAIPTPIGRLSPVSLAAAVYNVHNKARTGYAPQALARKTPHPHRLTCLDRPNAFPYISTDLNPQFNFFQEEYV